MQLLLFVEDNVASVHYHTIQRGTITVVLIYSYASMSRCGRFEILGIVCSVEDFPSDPIMIIGAIDFMVFESSAACEL